MLCEHVVGHRGHHHVQFELTGLHRISDGGVVANHLEADHGRQLRHHGIDLAGHDGGAGLQAGQINLRQAGIRPREEQAEIVRDADDFERDPPQSGAYLGHAGVGLHGPAHVCGGRELLAGDARQIRDRLCAVIGVRVDAGADGAASQPEFAQRVAGHREETSCPFRSQAHRPQTPGPAAWGPHPACACGPIS